MRDLKECQAEVFRRSEKRIRARKQRRGVLLTACVPLALCGVLLSVMEVPTQEFGTSTGAAGVVMDGSPEYADESLALSVARIEVSGADGAWTVTDDADLLAVSAQLDDCMRREPESNGSTRGDNKVLDSEESQDDLIYGYTGYTIRVIMNDGTFTEYLLSGTRLENKTSGGISNLTQSAAQQLKALLGIERT